MKLKIRHLILYKLGAIFLGLIGYYYLNALYIVIINRPTLDDLLIHPILVFHNSFLAAIWMIGSMIIVAIILAGVWSLIGDREISILEK